MYCVTTVMTYYLNGTLLSVVPSIFTLQSIAGILVGPLTSPSTDFYGEYMINYTVSLPNGYSATNIMWQIISSSYASTCTRSLV